MTSNTSKIPVTIVIGFLGAGKTTLVQRLLSEQNNLQGKKQRLAFIKNEIGDVAVDAELLAGDTDNIVELDNGCLCCSLRGQLVDQLHKLAARRQDFDCLVIETTGAANPGPVINTFGQDGIAEIFEIDCVVCVVDAANIHRHIEKKEVRQQLALADVILLNKSDLVDERYLEALEAKIKVINGATVIYRTQNSVVALDKILNTGRFSRLLLPDNHSAGDAHTNKSGDHDHDAEHDHGTCDHEHGLCTHGHDDEHDHSTCDHDHDLCTHDHGHAKKLDQALHSMDIQSFSVYLEGDIDGDKLLLWIPEFVERWDNIVIRIKGFVAIAGQPDRFVIHGVYEAINVKRDTRWADGEKRGCTVVFIGEHLNAEAIAAITQGFTDCRQSA